MIRTRTFTLLATLILLPSVVLATVPRVDRLIEAVVETNRASGRQEAIRLELTLSIDDRRGIGRAELISLPQGLARLELRGAGGLVERHLLQGPELLVSRNAEMLREHRAFLPPFFMLQAESADAMQFALQSFGIRGDVVGLATCGQMDCLVVGDPRRAIEMPEHREVEGLDVLEALRAQRAAEEAAAASDGEWSSDEGREVLGETEPLLDAEALAEDEAAAEAQPESFSRLWIDRESYEVRGIDSAAGIRIRFGPIATFDDLRVPAWITIEEPTRGPARFDVVRASRVNAPPSAFTPDWLVSPIIPEDGPGPSAPARIDG